ncbi:MAG: phosphoheptose isomerase, partial [Bacteroidales bacterium]|nr:phosphoheptose isomerase [Bacteroidales bacterium]
MSFMYNPFPFDDPRPVNRPELSEKTINAVVSGGTPAVIRKLAAELLPKTQDSNVIVAFDGYTATDWKLALNLLARECRAAGVEFESVDQNAACFKSGDEIDAMIDPLLVWDTKEDPTLLYGKIYKGGYEGMLDERKTAAFETEVKEKRPGKGKIVAVYGYGCLIPRFRELYDVKCFFDITPKTSILRIRKGEY